MEILGLPFALINQGIGLLSVNSELESYHLIRERKSILKNLVHCFGRSSQANDVRKQIFGSVVPVLKGEKFSLRMLVIELFL